MSNADREGKIPDEDVEPSTLSRIVSTTLFVMWGAAAGFLAFGTMEFGVNVDGIGYGHMEHPTVVSAVIAQTIVVLIGLVALLIYKRTIHPLVGLFVGGGIWVATCIFILGTLDWHYARICDATESPRVCGYLAQTNDRPCKPGVDDTCVRRMKIACHAGDSDVCELAVEHGVITHDDRCDILADKCETARKCAEKDDPQNCASEAGFTHNYVWKERFCVPHQQLCSQNSSPSP